MAAGGLAVHEHVDREPLRPLVPRAHVLDQSVQRHRRLLRVPPVGAVAVHEQVPHGAVHLRIVRIPRDEGLDGERRRVDARIREVLEQRIAVDRPPGELVARLRLGDEIARQRVAPLVCCGIEREEQQRAAVGRHASARRPQVVEHRGGVVVRPIARGHLHAGRRAVRQHVRHVGLQIRHGSRVRAREIHERRRAVVESPSVDRVAGLLRLDQAVEGVRGHERMGLVRLPPAPAAVFVLVVGEAFHAFGHLPAERADALGRGDAEVRERPRDDQVGHEAGQGLLRAAVRERGEEVERADKRSAERWRERDLNRARGGVRALGDGQLDRVFLRGSQGAGGARLLFQPVGQDRNRKLQRIRLVRRLGRAGERGRAGAVGAIAEVEPIVAARRDRQRLGAARACRRRHARRRHRHGDRLRGRQIVVDDRGHRHFVAFGQEARRHDPQDEILGRQRPGDRGADARVGRDRARRQAPRGERVRILHLYRRGAVGPGHQIGDPVDGIRELFAHLRAIGALGLEVSQRERAPLLREQQLLPARVAHKRVLARVGRADAAVVEPVELTQRVGRPVRLDGVHRFVDDRQAELRAYGLTRSVDGLDREDARLPRLRDRLRRLDRDLDLARARGDLETPLGAIQAIVFQERHADVRVAHISVGDGHLDDAAGIEPRHAVIGEAPSLFRDERGRLERVAAQHEPGDLARLVLLAIGHELQIPIALVHVGFRDAPRHPDVRGAFDRATLPRCDGLEPVAARLGRQGGRPSGAAVSIGDDIRL